MALSVNEVEGIGATFKQVLDEARAIGRPATAARLLLALTDLCTVTDSLQAEDVAQASDEELASPI